MKVISHANLPVTLPIYPMLTTRIALDHWHFSRAWYVSWWWFWGIVCAFCIFVAFKQRQVNIFRGSEHG